VNAGDLGRLVGSWLTVTGNSCDVYLGGGLDVVTFAWDRLPLSARDVRDYERRILPAVLRVVGELLERPGRALVVRL